MTLRVAFLRHGHTAWNREHRIQGRSDIPLDDEARASLARLAVPSPWDAMHVVSSPLVRAVETARLVVRDPDPVPALIEMKWGAWEGRHGTDLRADPASGFRDIEDWGWSFAPPGGEPVAEVRARVQDWLSGLTEDTLVVTHIGVMRVALALAWGWEFDGPCPFAVKRNRLFIIEGSGTDWSPVPKPVRLVERGP